MDWLTSPTPWISLKHHSMSALPLQADIHADDANHVSVIFRLQKRGALNSCDMNSATANGVLSGRCSRTKRAVFPAWTTGAFSTASFGSCDQVHHGVICPRATVPIQLATIGLFAGGELVCGTGSWMRWRGLMMRPCK